MAPTEDTTEEQTGAVQANRHLRRAVDRCLGDGIRLARVAQALVRMAEAVASEVAEEQAVYRTLSQERVADIAFGATDQRRLSSEQPGRR